MAVSSFTEYIYLLPHAHVARIKYKYQHYICSSFHQPAHHRSPVGLALRTEGLAISLIDWVSYVFSIPQPSLDLDFKGQLSRCRRQSLHVTINNLPNLCPQSPLNPVHIYLYHILYHYINYGKAVRDLPGSARGRKWLLGLALWVPIHPPSWPTQELRWEPPEKRCGCAGSAWGRGWPWRAGAWVAAAGNGAAAAWTAAGVE